MNEEVKSIFKFNAFVINKNLEDVTHDESVISPLGGGNSINWILGHIILNRDYLLELLGFEGMCDENTEKFYSQGTQAVAKKDAVEISTLLKIYNDSQVKIMQALDETDIRGDKEKMDNIPGLSFHEAYHAGQTGVLRRVIGKTGMIK